MANFSIIVPVYNESDNIKKLILEIFKALNEFTNFELIIIDDGSEDNTLKIIKDLQSKYLIKIIEHKNNLGQSYSIISGIKDSKHDIIVTLDGDGQNNPFDIPKLLKIYLSDKNYSLVGGIRTNRKDTFIKIFSSKIANKIRSVILKDNCVDTGCSLKVFDKNIFLRFPHFDGIHRFLPALFKGFGKKTYFASVDHRSRVYGKSKYGTLGRLFKGINDLIRVKMIIYRYKSKK